MAKKGGKRPNSGRKPGSVNALNRQLLKDVISEDDKKKIVKKSLELAKKGDSKLLQYFMDQIHGKAPTPIDVDMKNSVLVKVEDLTTKTLTTANSIGE